MSLASRKLIQATAGAAGAADTGDDDFANVVLLLDGDGTSGDANNTFTDSSTNGFTVTESGSVVQGSFSPYGNNWSVYFDGSSEIQTDSTINIGTSNFTIEFWVNWDGQDTDASFVATDGTTGSSWVIRLVSSDLVFRKVSSTDITTTHTMEVGVWTHVAVVREGTGTNQVKIYVNGVNVGEGTATDNYGTREINIGAGRGSTPNNVGHLSNVRLVVGSAVYTGGFTPSTTPLTDITNTKLLTCQSNRFVDNSSIGDTFTLTGTPKVSPFSPFKNDDARDITTDGGSGYFDGSAYLTASDNAVFNFGTGDFTVEAWVYSKGAGSIWSNGPTSSGSFGFYFQGTNELRCDYYGGTALVGATQAPDYAWHHVAVIRSGSTLSLYLNGSRDATTTTSSNNTTDSFAVGRAWTNHAPGSMEGYIADLRVIKGTALYTGTSYTVPTAPLTAVTNTSALLNFQDAGIYDRSGINNLDTLGNAQIDTAVKKYGTGSMEFDGTGDYLKTVENETLELGSGDWTIEFWIYFDAVNNSTVKYLLDWRTAADTSNSFLAQESNNNWTYYNGAGASISSGFTSSTFSASTWHHVAISKAGTTTKFFVDGTQTASSSDVSTYDSGTLVIGSRYNGQNYLDGYIDDLRITKGIARYTSSFTPPTDALPKF